MKKLQLFFLFLCLGISASLTSCGDDDEKLEASIIGTWESVSRWSSTLEKQYVRFQQDGDYYEININREGGVSVLTGTWTKHGNKIYITGNEIASITATISDVSSTSLSLSSIGISRNYTKVPDSTIDKYISSINPGNKGDIRLDRTAAFIDYGTEIKLTASKNNCAWSSSNEFVASVNNDGTVTANHVGEAIITATKNGEAAICKVTVVATNNTYVMPVIAWGESMTRVEAAMGEGFVKNAAISDNESLFFSTKTDIGFPWYIYLFDNNKLTSSSLTVELDDDLKAVYTMDDYIEQRFKLIGVNETTLVCTYANAETVAGATTIVRVQPSEDLGTYMAVFTENTNTKAGAVEDRIARIVKKVNSIIRK